MGTDRPTDHPTNQQTIHPTYQQRRRLGFQDSYKRTCSQTNWRTAKLICRGRFTMKNFHANSFFLFRISINISSIRPTTMTSTKTIKYSTMKNRAGQKLNWGRHTALKILRFIHNPRILTANISLLYPKVHHQQRKILTRESKSQFSIFWAYLILADSSTFHRRRRRGRVVSAAVMILLRRRRTRAFLALSTGSSMENNWN